MANRGYKDEMMKSSKLMEQMKKDMEESKRSWFNRNRGNWRSPFQRSPFNQGEEFENDRPGSRTYFDDPMEGCGNEDLGWPGPSRSRSGSGSTNWDKAYTIPVKIERSSGGIDETDSKGETKQEHQHQRSNSEPPQVSNEVQNEQAAPKRFTSKIEITPTYEEDGAEEDGGVRHIPIIVEGRKMDKAPGVKRKMPDGGKAQPAAAQEDKKTVPEGDKKPVMDPVMGKIEEVRKDVEQLMEHVGKFEGKSRQDREFLYLDEMLTRNLIKLDTVEVEGKPEARKCRKEAIGLIQKCINILEEKVPLVVDVQEGKDGEEVKGSDVQAHSESQEQQHQEQEQNHQKSAMDVDENAPTESDKGEEKVLQNGRETAL